MARHPAGRWSVVARRLLLTTSCDAYIRAPMAVCFCILLVNCAGSEPNVFNFVCEIPRGTTPKFEIATGQEWNPIVQDRTAAGTPRYYALEPIVNYGALPQTYEDPAVTDVRTGLAGDGDPLDVCEIGIAKPATVCCHHSHATRAQ